jgi:hypothetical protein
MRPAPLFTVCLRPGGADRLAEPHADALLGLVVQRGLDDVTAERPQALEHLLGRVGATESDQGRRTGLELVTELLEEVVVHADVRHLPRRGAARGADGHAHEGREEDQADQAAPDRAAGGTGPGRAHGLMQLDLAVRPVLDHDRVLEGDQMLLGRLDQRSSDLLGRLHVRVGDRQQCAHVVLLLSRRCDGGLRRTRRGHR